MNLAKNCIDVGLMTNRLEETRAFYGERLHLPFEEMLPLGSGSRQYRYGLLGSVLKINNSREPVPEGVATGYRRLIISDRRLPIPMDLVDPDGTAIRLVPSGQSGIGQIGIELAVTNEDAFHRFFGEVLGGEKVADRSYRVGETLLSFAKDLAARRAENTGPSNPMAVMRAVGFRYMTIQVRDVDSEHARLKSLGVWEGAAPVTLGKVARISFIRDPDGNFIEISQRASLTGALPE